MVRRCIANKSLLQGNKMHLIWGDIQTKSATSPFSVQGLAFKKAGTRRITVCPKHPPKAKDRPGREMTPWLPGFSTLGFKVNTGAAIYPFGLVTSYSSSDEGSGRGLRWSGGGQKNGKHVIHYCHSPANHAASAIRRLLLLLLWDTWSPTAKKTQLGSQPGNVICASLRTAFHISAGSFAQIGATLGLCLHRGSSKIRDADVMFHEHVTVVLCRVGLLSAKLH